MDQDEKVKNIAVGMDMIKNQFFDVLSGHGLEKVETKGQSFDPNFHEAMSQKEDPSLENDTILEVQQNGYLLNKRLVRPAKVVVVKNESK